MILGIQDYGTKCRMLLLNQIQFILILLNK